MFDLLCFSHLRWDFVYQRPQHLLTRCAKMRRVFYVEEPCGGADEPKLEVKSDQSGVHVVSMHIPDGLTETESESCQKMLLRSMFDGHGIGDHVQWFYTPMAVPLAAALPAPLASVYDCMDELSGFHGAPKNLLKREQELLSQVDVVFTGGHALFEAKRGLHHNVHPFPSSVDVAHFAKARVEQPDPADQAGIARPRLGFFGVIDERMDLALLEGVARRRPDWQIVMVGPVVKIDPDSLPRLPNIHYLGAKSYQDLPSYVAGWDVAIMPFAKNEATRYISPTKAPEYLAAGMPLVSTSIRDVVRPYSVQGLAHIADTPEDFVAACEACMSEPPMRRLRRADAFLSRQSWDKTWEEMDLLMQRAACSGGMRDSGTRMLVEIDEVRLEVG